MRFPIFLIVALASAAVAARTAERTVFDLDLTTGDAGSGIVTGGDWDGGWRCTGTDNERIVWDPGAPIANGRLEVSFTTDELPWLVKQGKINIAGLYDSPALVQNVPGGLFYFRTGSDKYKFGIAKASGRRFDRTGLEPRVGALDDWIADGRTVMTMVFEWRDGVPIFHDTKGRVTDFPRDIVGGDTPMVNLRYVFVGSDHYTGLTVKGLRFTRVKLVDYGPDVDGPPTEPLSVSQDGRWLEEVSTGRQVFLLADTAWSMVMLPTREELDAYLRHRRAQRFNAVAFVLVTPGKDGLSDGLSNIYGARAFATGKNGRDDPTRPLVTPGADPAKAGEYDYWDHVDYAVAETKRLGLHAIVHPTWGSGVVGDGNAVSQEDVIFDEHSAYAYGHWLGVRYGAQKHIIWMLGGDRLAVYHRESYGEKDFRPVFRAMAEGLADGAHGVNLQDGVADYSGLLMSYHSKKNQPKFKSPQSGDFFHGDPWLSFNSIQAWPEDQAAETARDWARVPPKPTWLFEGRYEGYWRHGGNPDDWKDWQSRFQAWQTVFVGAFGTTYGHERVFGFGNDGWDWKKELDAPGAQSMTHLAKFMNCLRDKSGRERVASPQLIAGDPGRCVRSISDLIVASSRPNGQFAMFYTAGGRTIPVDISKLSSKPMNQWWFNPRTGRWLGPKGESESFSMFARDLPSGPGQGVREFDPPGEPGPGNDWVLVLATGPALD